MNRVEITLEVVTDMFSEGINSTKEAEFRITELKALLRSTFREFFDYTSLDDLKEKEEVLFGSTNRKSPVIIRFGQNNKIRFKDNKEFVLRKNMFKEAIPSGTRINIIFQGRNENILKIYLDILKLASITGGLGKRSRKGMGAFKIKEINSDMLDINKRFGDLLNSYNEFEAGSNRYIIKTRKLSIDEHDVDKYIIYKIEFDSNMPNIHYVKYLHKIFLGNLTEEESKNKIDDVLKKVSKLTHDRLSEGREFFCKKTIEKVEKIIGKKFDGDEEFNKEILGNYKEGIVQRFASPVYVTIYQEVQENNIKNYLIIEELNYNYIYDQIINKKVSKKIKELENRNIKITNDIRNEERKRIASEVEKMKTIDTYYIKEYVNKIKEYCEVK